MTSALLHGGGGGGAKTVLMFYVIFASSESIEIGNVWKCEVLLLLFLLRAIPPYIYKRDILSRLSCKKHTSKLTNTAMTQWPNLDHFHQVDLGKTRIEMAKYTQPSHRETLFTNSLSTKSWRHSDDSVKTTILLPPERRQTHSQSTAHARKLIRRYTSQKRKSNCNCNWHIGTSRKSTSQVHFTIE